MRNTDWMLSADKQQAQLILFCLWLWKMKAIPSDSFALIDLFTHALLFISVTLSCGCCRLEGLKRSSDPRSVMCGGKLVDRGSHPRLRTASLSLHSTRGDGGGKRKEKLVLGQEHSLTLFDFLIYSGKQPPEVEASWLYLCFWSSCSSHTT